MSETTRDLLTRGIAAAKDGAKEEARFFLEWALRLDPPPAQCVKAWWWLSEISDDEVEQQDLVKRILVCDPVHPQARRKLALLEGRLEAEEIVDPENLVFSVPAAPESGRAQQFTCSRCGGRMTYTPDGESLTCEYCERQRALTGSSGRSGEVEKGDFIVALATAEGHGHPVAMRALSCEACGAHFVLSPETLSFACPYCASVYVVDQAQTRDLVPPKGVVPFSVTRRQAEQKAQAWLRSHQIDLSRQRLNLAGVYLPAWTFDVGGRVTWQEVMPDEDRAFSADWGVVEGSEAVNEDDLLVPATHTLPSVLARTAYDFHREHLVPYDPGYLADWPAEMYTISAADASLVARRQALRRAEDRTRRKRPGRDIQVSSSGMGIVAFRLVLVSVWLGRLTIQGRDHVVVVNGRTGVAGGEKPLGGIQKWLSRLLGLRREDGRR